MEIDEQIKISNVECNICMKNITNHKFCRCILEDQLTINKFPRLINPDVEIFESASSISESLNENHLMFNRFGHFPQIPIDIPIVIPRSVHNSEEYSLESVTNMFMNRNEDNIVNINSTVQDLSDEICEFEEDLRKRSRDEAERLQRLIFGLF